MQTTSHEKAEGASSEMNESCEVIGQRTREAPVGWIIRSSRHNTRTFRKRWSMKKDGIILVCMCRKKQEKRNQTKGQDKSAVLNN